MSQRCKTADELGKMVFKARISSDTRAYVRLAKEWKSSSAKQIIQRSHISRASLYHILKEDKIRENNQERQKEKKHWTPPKIGCTGKAITSSWNPKIEEIRREIYCEATYAASRRQSKECFLPNSTTVSS